MELFFEFVGQQWMLFTGLLVVLALLALNTLRKAGPAVSPQQSVKLINSEDGIILDIRAHGEYSQGHIPDALNIPAQTLEKRIAELEKHKDTPIVVVCKMGQTAGTVVKQLIDKGYPKVYRMSGGMMEWNAQQLPTVKK